MAVMRATRPYLRLTMFWLALAILAGGRGLVPSGWMPVAHAGEVTIALCGGAGPVTISLDRDGKTSPAPAPGSADDNAHQTCPYAVSAHAADIPTAPVVVAAQMPVISGWPQPVISFDLARPYAPRPPTRGPPHTV